MNNKRKAVLSALVLCVCLFAFSLAKTLSTLREYQLGEQNYASINDRFIAAEELIDGSSGESFPNVDFAALCEAYPDVVGWIYSPDTAINYPVVQGGDNDQYFRRLPDGTYNYSGSIFMDYRNDSGLWDMNTLICGHNMKNGSMFSSLLGYKSQAYYEEHPVMFYLTPNGVYTVDLIGGYTSNGGGEGYVLPETQEERNALIAIAKERSTFVSDVEPEPEEGLVTFFTCDDSGVDGRYILLGVMRKLPDKIT